MPGCREPIEQGRNGFLVPPRDVDALSNAMERLLECPALLQPMGEAARRSAVDIYDVERVNRQLLVEMEVIGPDPTPASPTLQPVNDTIVATA
jgi:glycosyltransferase involved in cell wall biosynthesis